jgi:hypothetical protein
MQKAAEPRLEPVGLGPAELELLGSAVQGPILLEAVTRLCSVGSGGHQGTDLLPTHNSQNVSRPVHIENDHG